MNEISLPTDDEGFITQECPECNRKFKIKYEKTEPGESRRISFCPYCKREGKDFWWTDDQMDFIKGRATELLKDEFEKYANDLSASKRNEEEIEDEFIEDPNDPEEEDFGKVVRFECHDEEVKIIEEWDDEVYCIICGEPMEI